MTACLVSAEKTRRKTRWRCSAFSCAVSPFLCVHVDVSRTAAAGVSLKHSLPSSEAVIEAWSKNGFSKKKKKRKCYLWVHIIFWRCAHFFFWSLLALRVVDLDAGRLFFWEHRWHICVKRNSDWDFKSEVLQFHPEKPSAGSLSSLVWIWPGPVTALSMEREVCLRLIGEATYRRRSCPLINNMRNVNEHIRATATQITTGCNQDFFFFLFTHNTEY